MDRCQPARAVPQRPDSLCPRPPRSRTQAPPHRPLGRRRQAVPKGRKGPGNRLTLTSNQWSSTAVALTARMATLSAQQWKAVTIREAQRTVGQAHRQALPGEFIVADRRRQAGGFGAACRTRPGGGQPGVEPELLRAVKGAPCPAGGRRRFAGKPRTRPWQKPTWLYEK